MENRQFAHAENKGAKSILHERNKYLSVLAPVSAIHFHNTKEGKERRALIRLAKKKNIWGRETQRLRQLNDIRSRGAIGRTVGATAGGVAGVVTGATAGSVVGGLPGALVGSQIGQITGMIGGGIKGSKMAKKTARENSLDAYSDYNYDGGTGAGSPGVSSAGAMGGFTNKGLRPLSKTADERAKAYALKQLRKQ